MSIFSQIKKPTNFPCFNKTIIYYRHRCKILAFRYVPQDREVINHKKVPNRTLYI